MAQSSYCKGCKQMTIFVCKTCEIEPGPATRAMLDLCRALVEHPRGSKIGIAKVTMSAFLAEWGESA